MPVCAQYQSLAVPHFIVHFGEGRGRGEKRKERGHAVLVLCHLCAAHGASRHGTEGGKAGPPHSRKRHFFTSFHVPCTWIAYMVTYMHHDSMQCRTRELRGVYATKRQTQLESVRKKVQSFELGWWVSIDHLSRTTKKKDTPSQAKTAS